MDVIHHPENVPNQVTNADLLIPPGRTGHVAVTYENYMFVWGGYRNEDDNADASTYFDGKDLWIHSFETGRWYSKECQTGSHPPGMSGCAAVIINNALYLFGGYTYAGKGSTNSLFKLDCETFTWDCMNPTGSRPSPVDKLAGWSYENKLYVFGGYSNPHSTGKFQFVYDNILTGGWTNQFYMYDPATNHWSCPKYSGSPPSARAAHAVAIIGDKVYIFGGRHEHFRLNDLHSLNMQTMTWSGEIPIAGPVPEGRSWHSLTPVSNQFLIMYGGFGQTNEALSDCWLFDTKAELWRPIELSFWKPRLWHTACLDIHNEVLIYGGCKSNIIDINTTDEANDIITIRISPISLKRACLDKVFFLRELRPLWSELPANIQQILKLKVGSSLSDNLQGS